MHILFCLEYFPPHVGGVEQMMWDLTRALVRRGFTVTVLTSRLPGTRRKEEKEGVRIIRVRCLRPMRIFFNLLPIPQLIGLAGQADIIHCSTFNGVWAAWVASLLTDTPLVGTVHEVWLHLTDIPARIGPVMKKIYDWSQRYLLTRSVNRWIAVSDNTRKALEMAGLPARRLARVYNPVEVAPPPGWSGERRRQKRSDLGLDDTFTFLYFGRPGVWRGVEYLVQAFHRLGQDHTSRLLLVLSEEPAEGYTLVTHLIEEGPRRDSIILLPSLSREDLIETILSVDTVVVPSISEGFGLMAAEACTLGIPVIASRTASLPEVVSGKHLFAPPGNIEGLSAVMARAAQGGWEETPPRRFSLKETAEGYLNVYLKVQKESGKGS